MIFKNALGGFLFIIIIKNSVVSLLIGFLTHSEHGTETWMKKRVDRQKPSFLGLELSPYNTKQRTMASGLQTYQSSCLEPDSTLQNGPQNISDACDASRRDVPEEFICPITLEMIRHPMKTIHGHVFERQAILQWLKEDTAKNSQSRCPLTRLPLVSTDIQTDYEMLHRIKQYQLGNMERNYQNPHSEYMHRVLERMAPQDCVPTTTNGSPSACVWTPARTKLLDRVIDEYDQFIDQHESIEVLAK
jgi:U-box domain